MDRDTGNIGIGTSNPRATLEVNREIRVNSVYEGLGVFFLNPDGIDRDIEFFATSGGGSPFQAASNAGYSFSGLNNGSTINLLKMNHNGNIGMEIASPSERLEINGNAKSHGLIINPTSNNYGELVAGTVATINGAVHISSRDSVPTPY